MIAKILAQECTDPSANVSFAVVLRCVTQADVDRCHDVFCNHSGTIHVDQDEGGYRFLFIAEEGVDVDTSLVALGALLDAPMGGIELIETKNINQGGGAPVNHSFVFKADGTPDKRVILLSPSHAFGSGDHPSTGLAIEFLEEMAPLAGGILDVGCGTGVLSFVALQLGAESVLGVDIDEVGLAGARENAVLNGLEHRTQFVNRELSDIAPSYPLILANLTCSVLQYLLVDISKRARLGGTLIVSGLQGRQGDEAAVFLAEYGFRVVARKAMGKWHGIKAVMEGL